MHNTKKANLEYQITSTEGSLRYVLGSDTPDKQQIEFLELNIEACKLQLKLLDAQIPLEVAEELKKRLKGTLEKIVELQELRPSFGTSTKCQELLTTLQPLATC